MNADRCQMGHALPADLRGRAVLEIGCSPDFHAPEMKWRGAARVVAIDPRPSALARARLVSRQHGLEVELHQMPVYELSQLRERFDIVLFGGDTVRLRHPLLALDLIHAHAARDLLVFQTMLRGAGSVGPVASDYDFAERDVFRRPDFPCLHFVEKLHRTEPGSWWIPNRACAGAMLRSAGFDILDEPAAGMFVCRRLDREDPLDPALPGRIPQVGGRIA